MLTLLLRLIIFYLAFLLFMRAVRVAKFYFKQLKEDEIKKKKNVHQSKKKNDIDAEYKVVKKSDSDDE